MIHHVSIPAKDPEHVASVLTELFGGTLTRFGPYKGSFIAWVGDDHGTAIEVFPHGTELLPDVADGQANFRHNCGASPFGATHVAVSVDRSAREVLSFAERERWRAIELSRGRNNVIEFWIENRVMLEIMTEDMARDYVAAASRFRVASRAQAACSMPPRR